MKNLLKTTLGLNIQKSLINSSIIICKDLVLDSGEQQVFEYPFQQHQENRKVYIIYSVCDHLFKLFLTIFFSQKIFIIFLTKVSKNDIFCVIFNLQF